MLDKVDLPPTPPLPLRWGAVTSAIVIVGIIIAFFNVPWFRHEIEFVWEAGRGMFKKLFGI
jgi:hypothetical protein